VGAGVRAIEASPVAPAAIESIDCSIGVPPSTETPTVTSVSSAVPWF